MRIAIDISALQTPHRMRGIGFTILNLINHISADDRKKHQFILFMLEEDTQELLNLLNLEGIDYEVRYIKLNHDLGASPTTPGRLKRLMKSAVRQSHELSERYYGSQKFGQVNDIDAFIQPDQSQNLPRGKRIKKVLVLYDIIPYVLEWDYLWSYRTARRHGFPRLAAFRCQARRWVYLKKLKISVKRTDLMLAISEATKADFVRYVGAQAQKISVIHLGVSDRQELTNIEPELQRYHKSSWGYIAKPFKMDPDIPFLLYIGGADHRRRLDDLVAAFNNLRAQGSVIKLVLTGDILQGPDHIPSPIINHALNNSSYLEDIIFMGFVSDEIKDFLYAKALVFIYPSRYEGFGLPILEAMSHGTPVITYKNSSIPEVGGSAVIYAEDYASIADAVKDLIRDKSTYQKYSAAGLARAAKFSWAKTSDKILNSIDN